MTTSFRRPLRCKRQLSGTWAYGRYTAGPEQYFNVDASIQQATEKDLQTLPEGRRVNKVFKIFTDTELYHSEDFQRNPDQVEIDGDWYEVTKHDRWQNQVISHFAYIVTRVIENRVDPLEVK